MSKISRAAAAARQLRDDLREAVKLGVIRLDYYYPPMPGDIDHPDSFPFDVYYTAVPGLTFEMCQANSLTKEVEENFVEGIR